jgi:hypothetical protein
MTKQGILFVDLPPPADRPIRFRSPERPIWTENKAKLIERYLYYFVMITKHGAYIDGFAGPQYPEKQDAWAAKLVIESKPPFGCANRTRKSYPRFTNWLQRTKNGIVQSRSCLATST